LIDGQPKDSDSASPIGEATTSDNITASIQEVSSNFEVTSTAANESAASMAETAVGIQKIAESSTALAENSMSTQTDAKQGSQTVSVAVQQMQTVQNSVEETSSVIKLLGESSEKNIFHHQGHFRDNGTNQSACIERLDRGRTGRRAWKRFQCCGTRNTKAG
jgi:hypothetical protein